jgi:predicted nucleic acid-binding protein
LIFIDTGAFVARHLSGDQHHDASQSGWTRLTQTRNRCYTSNLVIAETITLLARRAGYSFAAARGRNILGSETLRILRPGESEEKQALDLMEKFADQEVSFTDCVSFALMRREKISKAFSFDAHFRRAGFDLWP